MEFAYSDILIGLLPGLALGIFGTKLWIKPKDTKRIVGSADDKTKLENEVLKDKVKQLEAKIETLESALNKLAG